MTGMTGDYRLEGLLAFGWGAPALLWWLAVAATPLIIHLLSRRRPRETEWAAMRFLLEAVRKNSRRLRLEQLLLLALRTLILLLVVLALAQLLLDNLGAFSSARPPLHHVVVIDASASMGQTVGDETLFDKARQIAGSIAEQGRPGDLFNVVRLSNLPPQVIVATPAYEASRVAGEIEQMTLPQGTGEVAVGLEQVVGLLKLAPEVPRKQVYLISDFQRSGWSGNSAAADDVARIRTILRQLEAAARVVTIDVGQLDAANTALTALELLDPFVTPARPARIRATIRNFSAERVTGRQLELLVDDKVVEQRAIDLAAGAETAEFFLVPFAYGGERRVQARLQRDNLPLDDNRYLAVPVRDRLRVLCVNGGGQRGGGGKATDYLELALAPGGRTPHPAASAGRSRIEPVVISDGELQGFDLTGYDCVVFCNVRRFTDREAAAIEAYLQGGGGAVWCLGDQVSADNYNQVLYRQGAGPLPARLGDRQGNPESREQSVEFDGRDLSHPIVAEFQGNPDAGLERTLTYCYLQATPAQGKAARVALAFGTGDPAIIEQSFGRGRSVLVTTAVDEQWGTWPLWPSFLPLMHELVHFAVGGASQERQKLVGEAISEVLPGTAADATVRIELPDGHLATADIAREQNLNRLTFGGTALTGFYTVSNSLPAARSELFAVNLDPRESNLAKLTQDELAGDLFAGLELSYQTTWPGDSETETAGPAPRPGSLSRWILYGVLYLMFAEQILAWDFRRGLWLVCPPAPLLWRWLGRRP